MCDQDNAVDKNSVFTVESSHEIVPCVTRYQTLPQMLNNTSFVLNERHTKEAIVGLDHLNSFQPTVQIVRRGSTDKRGVSLNQNEWVSLLAHADIIKDFLQNKRRPQVEKVLCEFDVLFRTIYGKPTVIITERKNVSTDDIQPNS